MGRMKKKYTCGQATAYVTRNRALRKLQLSLADFRRLCILKGIYPVEPKNRKKVNKGSSAIKSYYFAKDIRFLAHEPVIRKFRELKIFSRRLKKAQAKANWDKVRIIENNKPVINLDGIIKERYPQFPNAITDLDDCLCLVFMFARFPTSFEITDDLITNSRRLYFEFLHYVMMSRSLRKCFISIKGYYFQANICGQNVTWILPHQMCHKDAEDVDMRIMKTFLLFYVQMLGFVNYKLYSERKMIYPPKLNFGADESLTKLVCESEFADEMLASLSIDPSKQDDCEDVDMDDQRELLEMMEENKEMEEIASLQQFQNLFSTCKFFLSREVPREIFAFTIRSFGGQVSWPNTVACGSTYAEDNPEITHQIIDRQNINIVYPGRLYVQPQWVVDSINAREFQPVDKYIPGATLPSHLSPFAKNECIISSALADSADSAAIDIRLLPSRIDEMTAEERKLREMMIPRKLKRVYNKAVFSRKKKRKELQQLEQKRMEIERKKTEVEAT